MGLTREWAEKHLFVEMGESMIVLEFVVTVMEVVVGIFDVDVSDEVVRVFDVVVGVIGVGVFEDDV